MKTRLDFVSNSSSSSYIIAVIPEYDSRQAAQVVAERVFGDEFEDVARFFENKTVLTAMEIKYSDWSDEHNEWMYNFIPAGICVDDSELSKWFDANGEVRNDLDIFEVIPALSWHNDDGKYGENEDIVYERRLMGKVTDKTLKFTKWLHGKVVELYGAEAAGYYSDSKIEPEAQLAEYEKNLAEGKKLYLTRFSYDGDAMCYGHIYIADTENWKRGIKQRMLEDSKGIKEAWFVDC